MGGSLNSPYDRAVSSTTPAVADVIAALQLPSISPLATDILGLSSLPGCQNQAPTGMFRGTPVTKEPTTNWMRPAPSWTVAWMRLTD